MRRYVLAVTSAALAAFVLFAGPAVAQPADDPVSGDDRATAYPGNVVGKDCAELFPGSSEIAASDLSSSVDSSNTYIDVTAVATGAHLAGIIVKGGPAYNVYKPGELGDLPWTDLHSPLVPSGEPAQISHWFACGVTKTTTTTSGAAPGTSSTESTESSTPSASDTATTSGESSVAGAAVTTTTSADVAATAQDQNLASTGFDGGWLIAMAGLLLAGGAALLLIVRLRAVRR